MLNITQKLKNHHNIVLLLPSKHNIRIDGVRIYHFQLPIVQKPFMKFIYYPRAILSLILTLPLVVLKEKIEIISTFIPTEASIFVQFLAKILGKTTIINLRGILEKEYFLTRLAWDLNVLFSDRIVVNSRDFVERYTAQSFLPNSYLQGKSWSYIPNAINIKVWKAQARIPKYDLIFIGNIQDVQRIKNKGIDTLIHAVSNANRRLERKLQVAVIGNYDLKQIIKYTGPIDRNSVFFLGHISNRDNILTLLNESKIFILSSRTEGMPNALMEAMALGKPCIATEVGAVEELIEDGKTGFLVPPNNPVLMADLILKLLKDTQNLKIIGENARLSMSEKFSWEKSIKAIEYFYKKR